ncbi:MAG: hypothetical protein ABW022_01880, partial [Actinoplanes sp.]
LAARPGEHHVVSEGRVWGTPAYFSPEQLCGQPTGLASDIYALGLVLHACLTGLPAWPGRTSNEVLIARACSPVPRLPEAGEVPESIRRIYRACLARTPRKRPPARLVARHLHQAARPPAVAGPARRAAPRRSAARCTFG